VRLHSSAIGLLGPDQMVVTFRLINANSVLCCFVNIRVCALLFSRTSLSCVLVSSLLAVLLQLSHRKLRKYLLQLLELVLNTDLLMNLIDRAMSRLFLTNFTGYQSKRELNIKLLHPRLWP